jgi:hypothetical protein
MSIVAFKNRIEYPGQWELICECLNLDQTSPGRLMLVVIALLSESESTRVKKERTSDLAMAKGRLTLTV